MGDGSSDTFVSHVLQVCRRSSFVLAIKFITGNKAILRKKDIPIFIICALFGQIAYYECEYNAMTLMPVALIMIVLFFTPTVSILIERIQYKRKANRKIF